jgi:hypothetical protein
VIAMIALLATVSRTSGRRGEEVLRAGTKPTVFRVRAELVQRGLDFHDLSGPSVLVEIW